MSTTSGSTGSTFSRASAHALSYDSPSSRSSLFSDSSNVDRSNFLQSEHRAGGPYLCSLPASLLPLSAEYDRRTGWRRNSAKIREDTEAILAREGITYEDAMIMGRQSIVDPEREPMPTVVVVTKQSSRRVAKEIHRALTPLFPDICVELIDGALLQRCRCFPVTRSESIFHKWEGICKMILSHSDISDWTALECWRYGTSENPTENPVTVVVSVLKRSTRVFHTATRRIRGILAYFNESDVAILFQKDEFKRYVQNPILPKEACTLPAQPGISIGIHSSSAGSSTLGGILQLRSLKNEWTSFGITCFHCVYAPEDKRETLNGIRNARHAFRKWMFSPVYPNDPMADKILRIDHPSVPDLRFTIEDANSNIKETRNERFQGIEQRKRQKDEGWDAFVTPSEERFYETNLRAITAMEAERDRFQKFLDDRSYLLGPVFAGSGLYRRRERVAGQEFMLDWALIRIRQERLGENKRFLYGATTQQLPLQGSFEQEMPLGVANSDMVLFKSGRSTSITQARFSELKSVLISRAPDQPNPVITWEYVLASTSAEPFSEPGDSGAFVFTRTGGVVGLLGGGAERNLTAYVTPINDIFDDIKRVTGAVEIRIAN